MSDPVTNQHPQNSRPLAHTKARRGQYAVAHSVLKTWYALAQAALGTTTTPPDPTALEKLHNGLARTLADADLTDNARMPAAKGYKVQRGKAYTTHPTLAGAAEDYGVSAAGLRVMLSRGQGKCSNGAGVACEIVTD